jgi:putative nucleotidyltransferase with HDIG domain
MESSTITLQSILSRESELASLPEIYIQISDLLDSETAKSAQIGQVVETDPALSLRILKMVNSAFYGFSHKVDSISQAITILGRERLKQILIGSVLSGVFGKMENPVFHMEDFWRHSVKTAILARYLSLQTDCSQHSDTLFTAGLLHDIGRLIMAKMIPEQTKQILDAVDIEDGDLYHAEERILGFTHCDVGAGFIKKWGLPDILASAAQSHHNPQAITEYILETGIIYIANNLNFLVAPIEEEEVEYALQDIPGWKDYGLSLENITAACVIAEEQVHEVMDSLGMTQMKIEG